MSIETKKRMYRKLDLYLDLAYELALEVVYHVKDNRL